MIESCPKKRMLLGITFLGVLTIVVLIVESHWTDNNRATSRRNNFIVEQNSTCFEKEPFEVIKDCEPCTPFELRSKSIGVCIHTHYKEVLKCANGEIVTRSCDRAAYYDEQEFWRFEGFMLAMSILSTLCVVARKKVLNKRMLQRVQRQLANCV
ncbi:protein JTB [Sitophilus oryzae]|uniref:Protein JTB n=1 Tax=Sitophilus oryzae TaxID=7048 RepID=A0A6J2YLE8_SITOR|nr:protein JTB [Sitophilus oryzae]